MKLGCLVAVLLAGPATGRQDPPTGAKVDFIRDIQPTFKAHCLGCHGEKKKKGQFRLDSRSLAFRGGVAGKDIVPGRSKESRLLEILLESDADARMPQDAPPLPPATIDLIRRWIDEGAPWPDAASGDAERPKPHWAYAKPVRPEPPAVRDAAWARTPVDLFIAAEHEARGLRRRPEASKPLLLRRLYLDFIGLPPTPEEREAFLGDAEPDAYDKVVDRLLADPRYGERWGRHWMDVWRYSDWAGWEDQVRSSQMHLWRWRDWIVESLNEDKGYDRMILEMLAGDELAPEDSRVLRATGFLARNFYIFSRNSWLEATVEHTSKAFLGTTLHCARCHNHMYDPITQVDYYRFRAFFEPHRLRKDPVPGPMIRETALLRGKKPLLEEDGLVRAYDRELGAPTYLFKRGDDRQPDKSQELTPGVPEVLGGIPIRIEPVKLPPYATAPHRRKYAIQNVLASAEKTAAEARKAVEAAFQEVVKAEAEAAAPGKSAEEQAKLRQTVQEAREKLPLATMDAAVAERKGTTLRAVLRAEDLQDAGQKGTPAWKEAAREAQAAQRKEAVLLAQKKAFEQRRLVLKSRTAAGTSAPKKPTREEKELEEAEKALAKAEEEAKKPPSDEFKGRGERYPETSTGRRLALARWIASDQNPLTARVAVNHLWGRHFGAPLVPNTFDFGAKGRPPSHPQLLDWLATELVRQHWSMKNIHRLLVTSSAYRMESTDDAEARAADPENRSWWRMNSRRMEAEVVRDSVLHLTGALDLTRGGPEISHHQGLRLPRRSLYFEHAPERQMEFLSLFDAANTQDCYERTVTVVPQQALTLSNSSLVREQSRLLARRLSEEAGTSARRFVTAAFERLLGRPPAEEEIVECERFLSEQTLRLSRPETLTPRSGEDASAVPPAEQPELRARESLVLVLMNHNDFVTIR